MVRFRVGGTNNNNVKLHGTARRITVGTLKNVSIPDFISSLRMKAKVPHLIERLKTVSAGEIVTRHDGKDILTSLQNQIETERLCDHSNQDASLAARDALNFTLEELKSSFPVPAPTTPDQAAEEEVEVEVEEIIAEEGTAEEGSQAVDKHEFEVLQREKEALQKEVQRLQDEKASLQAPIPHSDKTTEVDLSEILMQEKAQAAVGTFVPPADISGKLDVLTQPQILQANEKLIGLFEEVADKKTTLKGNEVEIQMLTEDHEEAGQLIRERAQALEEEISSLAAERDEKAKKAREKFLAKLSKKIDDPAQREEKRKKILSGKMELSTVNEINRQYRTRMESILNGAAVEFDADISGAKGWKESLAIIKEAAEKRARKTEEEAAQTFPEKRGSVNKLMQQVNLLSGQAEDFLREVIENISSHRTNLILDSLSASLAGLHSWASTFEKFIEQTKRAAAAEEKSEVALKKEEKKAEIPPAEAPKPAKKAAPPKAPPAEKASEAAQKYSPEVQAILSSGLEPQEQANKLGPMVQTDPTAKTALDALYEEIDEDLDV